jgi:hypothetical protein
MENHVILLIIFLACMAYYYYNYMEHYSIILNPNPTKIILTPSQHECSREAINKSEYDYIVNPINRGLRPN